MHWPTLQEVMTGFMNILEKVFPGELEAQTKALMQLQQFRTRQGLFGRDASDNSARTMAAHAWWNMYGACTPELQKVAIQVLSQVRASNQSQSMCNQFVLHARALLAHAS